MIDILIPDIFFDIKLDDSSLIDSYDKEFKPESYEEITKQPFDSGKKSDFLRLYYQNHKDRKKKLDSMIKKKQDLEDELYMIKLNQKGMTLNKEKIPIKLNEKIDKKILEEREKNVNEWLEEYWKRYETYSDNLTYYYKKVARENNFELVG